MSGGLVLAVVLGLLIGSFLNVCIARWPAGESVVSPRSRCPRCGNAIAWYDNVPVLSWLALRAKCRGCALPIPVRYPLVELATAAIWGWSAWRYGLTVEGVRAAVFLTILLGIAMTDAREYIIPDEFSVGGAVLGVAFAVPVVGGDLALLDALFGAATGFGLLYIIGVVGAKAFGREAMGGGDIKMMALIGAFTGVAGVFLSLVAGAVIGIILHLVSMPLRRRVPPPPPSGAAVEEMSAEELSAQGYLPFGVSLAIAAAVVFAVGPTRIVDWYLLQVLP